MIKPSKQCNLLNLTALLGCLNLCNLSEDLANLQKYILCEAIYS